MQARVCQAARRPARRPVSALTRALLLAAPLVLIGPTLPPPGRPGAQAGMPRDRNINILIRGQSNAARFNALGGMRALKARLLTLLGFDGVHQTITLLGGDGLTAWGGTGLLPTPAIPSARSWLTGNAETAWADGSLGRAFNAYLRHLPPALRASPTVTLWLHNENDSTNRFLSRQAWESAIRYTIGRERLALRQSPATTPVDFVFIPFDYAPGAMQHNALSPHVASIRLGLEELAADPALNAAIGADAGDTDMDGTGQPGGMHLNQTDILQTAARLAPSLANQLWQYAEPGSPAARAHGTLPARGPQAVTATLIAPTRIDVALTTANLKTLSAPAAHGAGWTIASGTQATQPTTVTIRGRILSLTFNQPLPPGAPLRVFYGWETGRIYLTKQPPQASNPAVETPGQGAAVYDSNGLPIWAPPGGLAVYRAGHEA